MSKNKKRNLTQLAYERLSIALREANAPLVLVRERLAVEMIAWGVVIIGLCVEVVVTDVGGLVGLRHAPVGLLLLLRTPYH